MTNNTKALVCHWKLLCFLKKFSFIHLCIPSNHLLRDFFHSTRDISKTRFFECINGFFWWRKSSMQFIYDVRDKKSYLVPNEDCIADDPFIRFFECSNNRPCLDGEWPNSASLRLRANKWQCTIQNWPFYVPPNVLLPHTVFAIKRAIIVSKCFECKQLLWDLVVWFWACKHLYSLLLFSFQLIRIDSWFVTSLASYIGLLKHRPYISSAFVCNLSTQVHLFKILSD